MMISQNPSESSITVVVKKTDLDKAVNALEMELLGKIIKKLEVTTDVAIVALIGSGMRGTVGVASRVFGAVAKKKVNVVMITQGASELNLAFVVKDSDCEVAVRALHKEFELANN
jgi:aspartate kinase